MEYQEHSPQKFLSFLKTKLSSVVEDLNTAEVYCADLRDERNTLESTIAIVANSLESSGKDC